MKIMGLDGRSYTWKLTEHVPLESDDIKRSSLHIQARELLREMYPLERVLEEVTLPGSGGLAVDFYIPTQKLFVEVQGRQHYQFIKIFYQDIQDFYDAKRRDRRKREWAEINNIRLVEFPYDESPGRWRERVYSNDRQDVGELPG